MIDTRDIAATGAEILTTDGHGGRHYTLTGPEAVSHREAAGIFSKIFGRQITYVSETIEEAWIRMRKTGLPVWHISSQLALAEYHREGSGTGIITDAVEKITHQSPRSFEEFACDYSDTFRQ